MRLFTATLCLAAGFASTALASGNCTVPMADWQPREALKTKLEGDGWQVRSIKAEDGCYEAYAINADGKKVEAYFDPKTFQSVGMKIED